MSVFTDIFTEVEDEWNSIETTVEADVVALGNILKPFLLQLLPSQFAIIVAVVTDNIVGLVINPGAAMTSILTDLEGKELAWWKTMEAQVQSNIIQAVTAVAVASAPAATTTVTPPPAS